MLSNFIWGIIGILSGFVICTLATASKIASLSEEYDQALEELKQFYEEKINEN